jgi:hypothetical protein
MNTDNRAHASSSGFPARAAFIIALSLGCLPAWSQNVSLGTAANFGALAGSTVTNTGPTIVTGHVGTSPGAAITGFPPGSIAPGTGVQHAADAVALQAQSDLTIAYNDAAGRICPAANDLTGLVLGSGGTVLTLTPGVYCFATSAQLTGNLTLNGAGVYIFQIGSTLTTASASAVTLINGAQACGVWWQVGSSATLGTTTALAGNILALTSITMNTSASISGRVLARNGAVTLDTNRVTSCAGGPAPPVPPPGGFISAGVPTLTTWGIALLAVLLMLTTAVSLRRDH